MASTRPSMSTTIMAARSARERGYLSHERLRMSSRFFSSHVASISFPSCTERVDATFSASARSACC